MNSSRMPLRTLLTATLLVAILAGCQSPTPSPAPTTVPQPTANLQPTLLAAQTQAVLTFSANLTKAAPTATLPPTVTATQAPTNTPVKPAGTATPTEKPKPSGPTATVATYCTIKSFAPTADQTISPNASFNLRWVAVNTGSEVWTQNTFQIMYWSGTRFVNQVKQDMPFNVGRGSDITIVTGSMTAPPNAGTYRSVWAIVKGFTPYCLLPAIVVVK